MTITVNHKAFKGAVDFLAKNICLKPTVRNAGSALGVLTSSISIEYSHGALFLTATDSETQSAFRIDATITDESASDFTMLRNPRIFNAVLLSQSLNSARPDTNGNIEIYYTNDSGADGLKIADFFVENRGEGLPYACIDKESNSSSVLAIALYDSFSKLLSCVSADETRYYLRGACMHSDNGRIALASTNGHALCRIIINDFWPDEAFRAIIPAAAMRAYIAFYKSMKLTKQNAARVNVRADKKGIEFLMPGTNAAIYAPFIDGNFPDYERVIPHTNCAEEITFNAAEMIHACKTLVSMSKAAGGDSFLTFSPENEELVIRPRHPDANFSMRVPFDGSLDFNFCFDTKVLLPVLKNNPKSKNIVMEMASTHCPALIYARDYREELFVAMPARV